MQLSGLGKATGLTLLLLFLAALIAVVGRIPGIQETAAKEEPPFAVRRGTNVSHWLSQSRRRGEERKAYFTRRDVEFLAGLGFDHLRIPVDEEQLWDEAGTPDEEAFALLEQALDWCAEFGLKAIVDLHILRSHHFDASERPLWTEAAAQATASAGPIGITKDRSV